MIRWLLPLVCLLNACLVSPDPALWRREASTSDLPDAAPLDRDVAAADQAQDSPGDQLAPDTGPPRLGCSAPELVGSSPPYPLYEVALRADGLELIAKKSGQWYSTKRTAQDQPFADWSTTALLSGKQDPTFFEIKGIELAIVATSPGTGLPRVLELCTSPTTCNALTLKDKSGQTVTDDTDGPSVAVLPGGDLLMAHNIGPGGSGDGHVYLATPSDPNDLSQPWVTEPATALDRAGEAEDDPALSPDGLVIVVDGNTSSGDNDLWVSMRPDLSSPFPAQVQLTDVNSSADDGSAYLAPLSSSGGKTRYELFFSSDRNGNLEVYRSECSW